MLRALELQRRDAFWLVVEGDVDVLAVVRADDRHDVRDSVRGEGGKARDTPGSEELPEGHLGSGS